MPKLSGIELLRRLRELKLPVPVIVITAQWGSASAANSIEKDQFGRG
jgi:CheY-like chemotaxis protein